MYKYPITIELLSETILGNGQSKNGIVNTDVLLDEEGFPYYLGKSFKGCLKKSMDTILKPFYTSNKSDFYGIVTKLFGSAKGSNTNEQNEGILKFTNFYLDKQIVDIFNEYNLKEGENKDLILSSLTDIRFGIKVGDNGVSESKSLRASRVLKKGLMFNGTILCSRKLEDTELKVLQNGVKSLKNLGINKSRGKGLVQVKIGDVIKEDSKSVDSVKGDFNYLLYEIDLKQPIKIGDSQSQYDYEQTKSYVSGSIVRGAVIGKYLKSKNINSDKIEKDVNFNNLLKRVRFYDAYPTCDGHYSFPTPNVFRTTKDIDKEEKKKSYKRNIDFSIVFDNEKIKEHEEEQPTVIKLKKGEFSYYENNILYQFNVKKDYRFHHSQELEGENIFRYESISKGQKFYGIVDVSNIENEDLKKDIYNMLKEKQTLYLGGSRTSGYGETKVSKIERIKDFKKLKEKLPYFQQDTDKNKLNIYFLSDSILRNEYHQITPCFSEEYLNKNLEINISKKNINSEIYPVILTGYNSTWKSYLPHVYGIEKGSVIRVDLNNSKNQINKNSIDEFIKNQKGDRKQDGLGRLIINPKFLNVDIIKYEGTNKSCEYEHENSFLSLDKELIYYIKESRNKAIVDKCIKNNTVKNLKNKKDKNISNSQINNIIGIIDDSLLSKEKPMDEFIYRIERLKEITQNGERNERNQSILDYSILSDKKLKDLLKLSREKKKKIVEFIISNGLEPSNLKDRFIKEIQEDEFKNDEIILKAIRDILYYSLKSKGGENIE
ncbi:RAMP superfamily CRISPR-associated protein [Clostridium sporogenes]|uniref:RAMP superfamily CRISPR-associated protein n=1 Tax=Clostridium sporogenes TaxID=1509 RepID=UPI0013D050B9|nr:RAMP superfamily CRISPR-associated protein [Clostridium sporogenes]NFD93566.1 CRISPR-associated protein [Clostridium sporogenes]NFE44599.1 CRISPR-associated protein [Clostridium sporogenes]NFF15543.1 CRISPR-associated protein [Clostridium sporogenes]NFF72688.1 CRISPR-associated protein [Clostridium sporogenes]NFF94530.1 CRISPR-associated protein [Clostridium sporogenes]